MFIFTQMNCASFRVPGLSGRLVFQLPRAYPAYCHLPAPRLALVGREQRNLGVRQFCFPSMTSPISLSGRFSPNIMPEPPRSQIDADPSRQQLCTVEILPSPHREIFRLALSNVLSTEIAEISFCQIVDGLPISGVENDLYGGTISKQHPLHVSHVEIAPEVRRKTREIKETFDDNTLQFDSALLYGFAGLQSGSRLFQTRLIELVAIAIHQMGTELHKLDLDAGNHANDGLASWVPSKDDEYWWEYNPNGALPTLFRHTWYTEYDQYPEGIADGVGFWAESRIFGGVVLFDRRDPETNPDADPTAVYLHPDRKDVTYRICKLLDSQKQALLEYLQSDGPTESPLPIIPSRDNRARVDPEEYIGDTGIYRAIWERKPLDDDMWDRRVRDVVDNFNYPTRQDWIESSRRGHDRKFRISYPDTDSSDPDDLNEG